MKIFKFTVIEREVCSWWVEDPKIEDFFFTSYNAKIQKCFDLTVQYKKTMEQSLSAAVSNEALWGLKEKLTSVLAGSPIFGLKFQQDDFETSFTIYEKYVEELEMTEIYRQRVRKYSNFFKIGLTEKEIEHIHPTPEEVIDPAERCFVIPMIEKQTDFDLVTYIEYSRPNVSHLLF